MLALLYVLSTERNQFALALRGISGVGGVERNTAHGQFSFRIYFLC